MIKHYVYLLIIFVLFLFFFYTQNIKENYRNDIKSIGKNHVSVMLSSVNNEIKNNKTEWKKYDASCLGGAYVLKDEEKNIVFKSNPTENEDKIISYNILDDKNSYVGVNSTKENNTVISGYFEDSIFSAILKKGYERVIITIDNGTITITGYGGFDDNKTYPYPWYTVIPIIFKEGNKVIAIIDYNGKKNKIKPTTDNVPIEITIRNDNDKYLKLLFQIYILLQDYIYYIKE